MEKERIFVTSPNFFNQDKEDLREWYKESVFRDLNEFIDNPNP